MLNHRKRLLNQRAVFRGLQLQLDSQAVKSDKIVHKMWSHNIACLGSGQHPQPEDVIQCLPLFRGDPYHLDYLMPSHVVSTALDEILTLLCLIQIYIMSPFYSRTHF